MIMKKIKTTFQIGMVIILSLFFANCSSSSDKIFDDFDHNPQLKAPHTYDIKFTRGDETIHYTGSITDEDDAYSWIMEGKDEETGKDFQVISLLITDGPLRINGYFLIDDKGLITPFNLYGDDEEDEDLITSGLVISDSEKNSALISVNGTPIISNLERQHVAESEGVKLSLISYTLKFSGDFLSGDSDENIYSATGTIVMSPYK